MKENMKLYLKQLKNYELYKEAVRWNEGFRKETDRAFANFWEREGDSFIKLKLVEIENKGNILTTKLLSDFIKEPDSNPWLLSAYCSSPETRQVQRKYGLIYPYHYNQPGLVSLSAEGIHIMSAINADGFVGEIEGRSVWISRGPCLQAIIDEETDCLDVKINLSCSKKK